MNELSSDTYEAPELRELGSVEELTQAAQIGLNLDADFPAGTPFGDLTVS